MITAHATAKVDARPHCREVHCAAVLKATPSESDPLCELIDSFVRGMPPEHTGCRPEKPRQGSGDGRRWPIASSTLRRGRPSLRRKAINRKCDHHVEAGALPFIAQGSAELANNGRVSQSAAEAAGLWGSVNIGAVAFNPTQSQFLLVATPRDIDASRIRGQGAVFGGVGREFMNDQRDPIGRVLPALDRWSLNRNRDAPASDGLSCG